MTARIAASRNVVDHQDAGHTLVELEYDPDLGETEWMCQECHRVVVIPGWSL